MDKVLVYTKGSYRKVVGHIVYHLVEKNWVEYFDDTSNPYSVVYESEAKLINEIESNEVRKCIIGDV